MGAWDSILNKIKDFGVDPDLVDQIKADTSSDEERKKALSEKDKLMSDMEFQGRAQHQIAKEFPTYSNIYGNRSIYNPKQDLSEFSKQGEVAPIIKGLKEDQSLANLYDQSFKLRDVNQNLAAKALSKDLLKSQNSADFVDKLRELDKLNYTAQLAPVLKYHGNLAETGKDPSDPSKKLIQMDPSYQDDLGTWLHEHLHAKNLKDTDSQKEALNIMLENPNFKNLILPQILENNDINSLRQQLSGGHFMEKPNTLPELYVQDKFEDIMKNRGFETRKDPIKSRFEKLKQLMRY